MIFFILKLKKIQSPLAKKMGILIKNYPEYLVNPVKHLVQICKPRFNSLRFISFKYLTVLSPFRNGCSAKDLYISLSIPKWRKKEVWFLVDKNNKNLY